MNDNLDQLTDTQLSEAVALEVAGWTSYPDRGYTAATAWLTREGWWRREPVFATSANPVLTLLEEWIAADPEHRQVALLFRLGNLTCRLEGADEAHLLGNAPTFTRAACLALLRAKRAQQSPEATQP